MSVTVRQLNADSTFLLIFSHKIDPTPCDLTSANGTFTVLIDPWLTGSSIVNAKWFAVTERRLPSAVNHLSEINEPDVVLISQNKPDHCHKETLLQLSPHTKTLIVAEPGAARAIKSWNHFDPSRVRALQKYDSSKPGGQVLRVPVPCSTSTDRAGQLELAFLPARNYVTGLHNAFGITFRPAAISGPGLQHCSPVPTLTPLTSPRPTTSPTSVNSFFAKSALPEVPRLPEITTLLGIESTDWDEYCGKTTISKKWPTSPSLLKSPDPTPNLLLASSGMATPASSTATIYSPRSSPKSSSSDEKAYPSSTLPSFTQTKAVSILYTPHGIPLRDIEPYVKHHLLPVPGALPLTCLLHSFDYATNPWWFGGNIMAGVEGGLQIAKALMARCWISAHDEVKDDQGIAVKLLRCDRNPVDHVRRKVEEDAAPWSCDVYSLRPGAQVVLSSNIKQKSQHHECQGLGFELGQVRNDRLGYVWSGD